jgi:branched-subunit amino acid ABC-type transport system permease component
MEFLYNLLLAPWVAMLTDPLFLGEVVIGGVLAGVMYALVALGFVLIYKASGVFNFAQGVMVLFAALSLVGLMEGVHINFFALAAIVLAVTGVVLWSGEMLAGRGVGRVLFGAGAVLAVAKLGATVAMQRGLLLGAAGIVGAGVSFKLPLWGAIPGTIVIMIALAFVVERVILRYMVNQEQIILFMATIGLTFFLEGFGETVWGSDVKKLDIGIPDTRLDLSKLALSHGLVVGVFAAAVLASAALLCAWRVRAVRSAIDSSKGLVQPPLIGPGSLFFGAVGIVAFLARFFVAADAEFVRGKAETTAQLFANLSWFGLALVTVVTMLAFATWLGRRQAAADRGADVAPLHYAWFVALGVAGALAVAAGIVWAVRGGILINGFELFAAALAAVLVIVLAVFFQKTRVGRALRAVADDHAAALSVGISLRGIWVIVWAVAGIVALAAGIIWGGKAGVQFSLALIALKALPVLILGGFTSVPGAIIGGLIIGVGEKLAEVYWGTAIGIDAIENWFAYMIALVFLLFRPQGLFGEKIIERV